MIKIVYQSSCKLPFRKSKGLPQQSEVAQGVPSRLRPWIFLTFRHYNGGRSSTKRTGRLYPRRNPWYSLWEAESTSGHMVLSEVPRKKSPVTPPGIDPGTARLVTQCLNHYATPGPKYPLFFPYFKEISIYSTDFFKKKSSNKKFHENPPSGSRIVPCRRTDRHDEANSRFTQFCERVRQVTTPVAYPGILFGGEGSTNSDEDRGQRERGSGGGSPLVRGSGGSCNSVQEISFLIVKFS